MPRLTHHTKLTLSLNKKYKPFTIATIIRSSAELIFNTVTISLTTDYTGLLAAAFLNEMLKVQQSKINTTLLVDEIRLVRASAPLVNGGNSNRPVQKILCAIHRQSFSSRMS